MTTLTVTEARATLPELLDRVEAGEEVTLTRHGRPVAVMVRPDRLGNPRTARARANADRIRELLEEGRATPLRDAPRISLRRAEELIAEIRRDRDAS